MTEKKPDLPDKPKKPDLLKKMAEKYNMDPVKFYETIKNSVFPSGKATNNQMAVFLQIAHEYDLHPFLGEIHPFESKVGGVSTIVGIDGWSKIVNRHRHYEGVEFEYEFDEDKNIVAVTAKIYRSDRQHHVEATEYLQECKRDTDPWKQWPIRMLRHKAFIQAARYAFGLSKIYDPDEAERIRESEAAQLDSVRVETKTQAKVDDFKERMATAQEAEFEETPVETPKEAESEEPLDWEPPSRAKPEPPHKPAKPVADNGESTVNSMVKLAARIWDCAPNFALSEITTRVPTLYGVRGIQEMTPEFIRDFKIRLTDGKETL